MTPIANVCLAVWGAALAVPARAAPEGSLLIVAPAAFAFSKAAETRKASRAINWLHLSNMKNLFSSVWRSLIRATYRKHDPFLVYSMASFNSGGGWNEFLLKASLQNA